MCIEVELTCNYATLIKKIGQNMVFKLYFVFVKENY